MKYFKDSENNLFGYDETQTPKAGLVEITIEEVEEIKAQKAQEALESRTNQEKIFDLEMQITLRNIRSAMLGDQYAIDHVTSIENQIAALR
jgi:hypothetical protein